MLRKRLPLLAAAALLATTGGCAHGDPATPTTPLLRARASLQRGVPEQAYAELLPLRAAHPDDLEVTRTLAEAAVRSGKAPSLSQQVNGENTRRETAANHYLLGLLGFARTADARGEALEHFQRAVFLAPGTAELHYRLGLALLESEQYVAAVPPLRRAAELDPTRPAVELPLAKALSRTGDKPGAVRALRALVAGDPSPGEVSTARDLMARMEDPFVGFPRDAQTRLEAGLNLLRNADRPQEAIIAFEDIAHDYPDLAVVHALLGLAYEKLDDAGRAVDEFHKATELAPDVGQNFLYLGQLYLARQRQAPAKESFERALELNPLLEEAYLRLGDMALEQRDLPKATGYFHALSRIAPADVDVKIKLAAALQLQGDLAGAEVELRRGLDLAPRNVELMLRMGLVWLDRRSRATRVEERRKATEEASRWLHDVLQVQPENALASRALQGLSGGATP